MHMGSTDLGSGHHNHHHHHHQSSGQTDHLVANGRNGRGGGGGDKSPQTSTSNNNSTFDEVIHKTILVGDSGVGKTSLLVQFDQSRFQSGSFAATVGIGFTNKVVSVDEFKVKLQIWDTAGQERFRSITHAYYRDAHALLLLYDVTSKTSFDNISAWLAEINEYAQDDVVIMLIGNKSDMTNERAVRKEDGEAVAREFGVGFLETSAKTAMNVELAFRTIARDLKMKKTRQCINNVQVSGNETEENRIQPTTGCC